MTTQESAAPAPVGKTRMLALTPQASRELEACAAVDQLETALRALRIALGALLAAPGLLGQPDEQGGRTEACEMRARWAAASLLMQAAVEATERAGQRSQQAVSTLLGV